MPEMPTPLMGKQIVAYLKEVIKNYFDPTGKTCYDKNIADPVGKRNKRNCYTLNSFLFWFQCQGIFHAFSFFPPRSFLMHTLWQSFCCFLPPSFIYNLLYTKQTSPYFIAYIQVLGLFIPHFISILFMAKRVMNMLCCSYANIFYSGLVWRTRKVFWWFWRRVLENEETIHVCFKSC